MTSDARTIAAVLREVRKLGNKRKPKTEEPNIKAGQGYHEGWCDACQTLESRIEELKAGKK